MKISVITLFPKMISGFFEESIVKKAQDKKLVEIELVNLRQFAIDSYGTVDDRPYGGGAGMVLRVEPIYNALKSITHLKNDGLAVHHRNPFAKEKRRIISTSPQGKTLTQQMIKEYARLDHLIILSGHYEGIDERINDYVDEEVSLGDFVLTGGEIVASVIVDSVTRLLPGVLKKDAAAREESFFEVGVDSIIAVAGQDEVLRQLKRKGRKYVQLLEYPHYTRPTEFLGKKVPEVLLTGDHHTIRQWRIKKAYERTLKKRPDLLTKSM